jgi:DNA-binding MarR family transcriptional regulator
MQSYTKEELFTRVVLEVFKLDGYLVAEGDRLTRDLGLSSARWKVLGALALSGSPLTVPQIAREMGQTRQNVQRLADVMVGDGLLEYRDNPQHKRARLVTLTARGRSTYREIEKKQIPWANWCARDLTKKELQTAAEILARIIRRFED